MVNPIDNLSEGGIFVVMIARTVEPRLKKMFSKYPVVGVLGPRQSGKTTLVRESFPNFNYISLEAPDNRDFAINDPRGFLQTYTPPVILDEIQRAPSLFSYIQEIIDVKKRNSQYIVTGSQNFILSEKISQTLAGRIYLINLPTFSKVELSSVGLLPQTWEEYAFRGTYPRLWDKGLTPSEWYPSYIQTYLDRDVRDIKNVASLRDFQTFLKLCAGRIGQTLVLTSLSNEIGVSHNTIKAWISVLEASFLIFLLKPYYRNLNKRLVKSPKLYFADSGLALNLLGITDLGQISTHPLRGNIFENLIVSELIKLRLNYGKADYGYFLRDKTGNEVDYVLENSKAFNLVEIKSSKTLNSEFLKNLNYWDTWIEDIKRNKFLVYTGDEDKIWRGVSALGWKSCEKAIL